MTRGSVKRRAIFHHLSKFLWVRMIEPRKAGISIRVMHPQYFELGITGQQRKSNNNIELVVLSEQLQTMRNTSEG